MWFWVGVCVVCFGCFGFWIRVREFGEGRVGFGFVFFIKFYFFRLLGILFVVGSFFGVGVVRWGSFGFSCCVFLVYV